MVKASTSTSGDAANLRSAPEGGQDRARTFRLSLNDLLGPWLVNRILTHEDGSVGRFEGSASWQVTETGALYRENGALWIGGQGPFTAERQYQWGSDLTVFFEDGRFFHQVPESGGTVAHWCPPDQYDGRYDFTSWPEWHVTWQVRGPRKAYVSETTYRRAGAENP